MRRRWWVFTGKTGGKSWENVGKTLEKTVEHVKILGKDGEHLGMSITTSEVVPVELGRQPFVCTRGMVDS